MCFLFLLFPSDSDKKNCFKILGLSFYIISEKISREDVKLIWFVISNFGVESYLIEIDV